MKTQVLWVSFLMVVLSTAIAQNQVNTTLVGNWGYGDMHAVAKQGSFVYVGSGSMFCVVDVSDSLNPVRKGKLFLNDFIRDIIISDNYAFVLNEKLGLRIIDISDPDVPLLVSTFTTPQWSTSMAKYGQYVYLGYSNDFNIHKFVVIDAINPENPVQVGSKNLSTSPKSIKISGNYAFIAAGSVGMRVLDISNPTTPTNVITTPAGGDADYIQVSGNYAYLGAFNITRKLVIMDITNPANPEVKYSGTFQVNKIAIQGNYAFMAQDGGFTVLDVSNPSSPGWVGYCSPPKIPNAVETDGNFAFVVGNDSGLCIIDVSEPANPYIYSSCDIPGRVYDISFGDDNLVYLTDWKGMRVIDFSNPAGPQEIGSFDFQGIFPYDLATNINYAVVYCYNSSPLQNLLNIIDISNPQSPVFLSSISLPHLVEDIGIHGTSVYLVDSEGLMVIDIANPIMPSVVFNYPGSYFDNLKISGNKAMITDNANMLIFDISDPLTPVQLVSYVSEYSIEAFDADENYAYLAYYGGMEIVDISEPTNPVKIGQIELVNPNMYNKSISVTNGYAYLAINNLLRVIDIGNPFLPVEVGYYENYSWYLQVRAYDHNAFVWSNYQLLVIQNDDFWVNIDEPGNPKTNELNVAILPNPSEGVFFVELPENDQSFECEIFNNQGLSVLKSTEKHKFSVDISSYPKGIYFLMIAQENSQIIKKLILN